MELLIAIGSMLKFEAILLSSRVLVYGGVLVDLHKCNELQLTEKVGGEESKSRRAQFCRDIN